MTQKRINLKKIRKINFCKFFAYDLETFSLNNAHEAYLITLYSEKEIKVWFKETLDQNIVREFIDYIKINYTNCKGFAHNAGNFDSRLVLDELKASEFLNKEKTCLVKEGNILAIYLEGNITLSDSFHLLPHKLAELAEQFKLEMSKGSIPH